MRVLFCVFPHTSHLHAVVPLAWALQNAGHEVRVALHPDALNLATDAGLSAVAIGTREHLGEIVAANPDPAKLPKLTGSMALDPAAGPGRLQAQWLHYTAMLAQYRPVVDDLVALARRWRPDLVLWDPLCVPAAVAAEVTGAAHARFLWGQDNIAWLRAKQLEAAAAAPAPGATAPRPRRDPVRSLMRPMLEAYGLDYREELLLGQWTVDPSPEAMRLPAAPVYVPMRWVPYNGGSPVPAWLDEPPRRPRVALTLGVGGRGRQLFEEAGVTFAEVVAAITGLGAEVVATGHPGLPPGAEAPEGVRLVDYLPLNQLLPTCSAVIHHGGAGSFAAAVAHRVPQLVTPVPFWSETETARYVEERGAGLALETDQFTLDALSARLRRLLTEDAFRDGALMLAKETQGVPGPAELVPVLAELTLRHRR
ncbi:nucleotide disphospho-sugar-binding domain-containing protein [Streptomyces sp. b94]|uniref:nucleotide disphospho-sugar-binding domain-containing protein n=1 Tax=Streptomyces sp. b94 TaxID=1827634 RepID=UPI000BEFD3A3|nr:nucleotide disphospho-sugar-binding domain-containing protein [Streptomyces sp. b94]